MSEYEVTIDYEVYISYKEKVHSQNEEIQELKDQLKREQNCVDEAIFTANNLLTSKDESWEIRAEDWLIKARQIQQQRK